MSSLNNGSIRSALLDDAPAILEAYKASDSFSSLHARENQISLLDVLDWLENASDKHPLLVFEYDSRVVAWCSVEPFYGLPAFDSASEVSLYVLPDWQGFGVGQRLLNYVQEQKKHLALTHLLAYVYGNNTKSKIFFEKQGFAVWGYLPNIARGPSACGDVCLYGLQLD
ncbi:N-acetyltransferase family protein [Marinomonas sp.]